MRLCILLLIYNYDDLFYFFNFPRNSFGFDRLIKVSGCVLGCIWMLILIIDLVKVSTKFGKE